MVEDDREIRALLEELAGDLREVLGRDLLALYVYGSFVSGGFDTGVSDLDLIAVTGTDAADLDLDALDAMHASFADRHPAWVDRIEVVYVGREALRSFRTSSGRLAVISPGEPFHLRTEAPVEWVQNWYLARETGVTLYGEPPTGVIPRVEWVEFVAAARRYAGQLAGKDLTRLSPGGLAYTVLTMCRAEETVIGGRHTSKQQAAAAAKARHPEAAATIEEALRGRLARGGTGFVDAAARSAAFSLIREIAASIVATRPPNA